jgi:solute carrier family 10 (sodium/bile acid cotransporter), member 7
VWQTISRSADDILSISASALVSIIAAGIGLHLLFLAFNYPVAKYILKLPRSEMKCVVIMASEKTLPVSIAVST